MKKEKKRMKKRSHLKATFLVLQRMTWVFLCLLIVTMCLYLGNRGYRRLKSSTFFQLKSVSVSGNHYLTKTDLIYYLRINEKSSLLTLDIKSLYNKLVSHPWIKNATIHRSLPNTLTINIKERVPVALIKIDRLYYVDRDGVVFDKINKEIGCDYPVFTGPRRFSEIRAYSPLISEILPLITKETSPIISEIHLDLSRGITLITMDDALPVRLGLKDLAQRFHRFLYTYHYLRRRDVIVKFIDCRYADRVVVKYAKIPSRQQASEEKREKAG